MSTHNLCFGVKIRKIGILLHTPVLLYKSRVKGDTLRTCYPDGVCAVFSKSLSLV